MSDDGQYACVIRQKTGKAWCERDLNPVEFFYASIDTAADGEIKVPICFTCLERITCMLTVGE